MCDNFMDQSTDTEQIIDEIRELRLIVESIESVVCLTAKKISEPKQGEGYLTGKKYVLGSP